MKTINYVGMLLVALILSVQGLYAQEGPRKGPDRKPFTHEQMTEIMAGRISQDLALDDATAAKFVEVYKKYMNEINTLRKPVDGFPPRPDMSKDNKDGKEFKMERKPVTDEMVEKMMKARFAQSRKMLDIREKYYDEFRKFLSPKQVERVYMYGDMARNKFMKEMERRSERKPRNNESHHPALPFPHNPW